ncbi:MAG: delta(1)-pyrroline-2-carboxylate reductase family protein [Comamonadaceae bacterium]|nr:MAG: delta(1)-pyrroline-2-carboxylate reductase family protein [Comamonadaceae bacterium]
MTATAQAPDDSHTPLLVCDPARTAQLLPFDALMQAIATAARDQAAGRVLSPERLVVPLGQGGVLLSMPATAPDIAIHKLVNVQPANAQRGLPTIHGVVTVCDTATGRPLCLLDGPEVTGRRTAAVSMLAIRHVLGAAPLQVLLIGTGVQARHHVLALQAVFPQARIWIRGRSDAAAQAFVESARAVGDMQSDVQACPVAMPEGVDVVITATTSKAPVYDLPARAGRLVIGVGAFRPDMAEIGPATLHGSALYADDPAGARHEAGDLLQAGIDWAGVQSLATLLDTPPDPARPVVFKSVGTAAWDLAAGRTALAALQGMSGPTPAG